MHGALSFARCRNVVLKAHDRILEHGEHQHTLGIEVKAPTIGGLVLVFEQNIRLKQRQSPLVNQRAGLIDTPYPKRRSDALMAHLRPS